MAGLNSFRDVIEDMFYNDIFNALSAFVEDNPSRLENNSYRVQNPDEAALSDFKVQFVNITESEGNEVLFDVVVSAEVEIAETVRRNRETDGIEQWFRVSCTAELEDGIQDFRISDIQIYSKNRRSKQNNLSEYLVPIIIRSTWIMSRRNFCRNIIQKR